MKKLLLFWLFSGSLDSFSQVNPDTLLKKVDALIARCKKMCAEMDAYEKNNRWLTGEAINTRTPDTLRAILLVTYTARRWGIAHARDGFVVVKSGEVIVFFTDKMECFPPDTELWGWRKPDEKFKKSKHGKN